MPDTVKKRKPKPKITFGKPIRISPPNVPALQKHIQENRKFKDDRLQELRKKMFRKDI